MSTTTTTTTTTTVDSLVPRGDVTATLNFYEPPADGAKPFNYVDAPPAGKPQNNFGVDAQPVNIHDLRGRESEPTLDHDAFQVLRGLPPSAEQSFSDDDSIRANYYPEVERLLLDAVAGADRVHIFDHTIRRSEPNAHRGPVQRAHIDQTLRSVEKRIRHYFPDEADALLARRFRIINVWRPLNRKPVESFPLAFASASSLTDADVIPVEHIYASGYIGETAAIRHNPEQKWYYVSGMTGDERILLECFDSESLKEGSTIGGRVPHTAFDDPRTSSNAQGRESIEIRALVFGN